MGAASAERTIQSAFPTLTPAMLDKTLRPLSAGDTLARLVTAPGCETLCLKLASLLLNQREIPLGNSLPGLQLLKEDRIPVSDLPVRVTKACAKRRIRTWADLLAVAPADLLRLRNVGERSMLQLLACAARTSAEGLARLDPHLPAPQRTDAPQAAQAPPSPLQPLAAPLSELVRWARYETDASCVGDLLSALRFSPLPPDIQAVRDNISRVNLDGLFAESSTHRPINQLLEQLLDSLDERDRIVFFQRVSYTSPRTLNDLAEEFGVTRERVRQLEVRARSRIQQAALEQRFAPIRWRAHTLRNLLGAAAPPTCEHFREAIARVTRDVPQPLQERMRDLLLWLAGPYERDAGTGWLAAGSVPGPEVASAFCNPQGRIDAGALVDCLNRLGIVPAMHPLWMEEIGKIRKVEGQFFLWSGTVADKAALLLQLWGRPATAEEIVQAIGEGHAVRGTRTRLFEDSRFTRVDRDRIALRGWGLKEYSGIAEAIAQEIDHSGGSANVEALVGALIRQFGLREASVRAYLAAPMFVIEGDTIRRRTEQDPFGVPLPVTSIPACYLTGSDALTWRIDVNGELLRGSGRPMPGALGAWLGISPGMRRVFTCDGSSVTVSWPETSAMGPNLGSIRPCLERAGCALGEQVLLRFEREEGILQLSRIDPPAVEGAAGLQRVSLVTGIPLERDVRGFVDLLGRAVGAPGTAASIKAALRSRGEADLAELVPGDETSEELDAAIDSLGGLL